MKLKQEISFPALKNALLTYIMMLNEKIIPNDKILYIQTGYSNTS